MYRYKKFPDNWVRISDEFIRREPESCKKRYLDLQSGVKKGEWSQQETNMLISLYQKYGKNFVIMAKKVDFLVML